MDIEEICKKETCLLTLLRSDLGLSTGNDAPPPTLLLLQLPPHASPSDLHNAHFIARKGEQAALVNDRMSYSVHRVETSNVLVMVPPMMSSKKCKSAEGSSLTFLPSRLLKKGGSGASFLELRPKKLSRQALLASLPVFDPYRSSSSWPQGQSIERLAAHLQSSPQQVQQELKAAEAFERNGGYYLLAEEAKNECLDAIVATLAEDEEYQNYASSIDDSICDKVVDRMSDEERFEGDVDVVRHCVETLRGGHGLDVTAVAAVVARRLFTKQKTPWEETLFLSRWQAELPGVAYQVELDMLRGVAVPVECTADERFWKYLPAEGMPSNPAQGFEILFTTKYEWTREELEPYLRCWVTECDNANDLLLRFTQAISGENGTVHINKA